MFGVVFLGFCGVFCLVGSLWVWSFFYSNKTLNTVCCKKGQCGFKTVSAASQMQFQ